MVQETLNLSQLRGYETGGTMHVVVNNQIGFTTPPSESRSTTYATDIAKMLQIPIFHVNGEDPDAVAQVVHIAMDFRQRFHKDVVIDMYCYRRFGHNEGDEPEFTQPEMYKAIKKRKSVRDGYVEHLLKLDGVSQDEADGILHECREKLEAELARVRHEDFALPVKIGLGGIWKTYAGGKDADTPDVDTGVKGEHLVELMQRLTTLPENFTPHPKIERLIKQQQEMARGERPLDWGAAEALALASLAYDGARVRLSGQDTERGTFSHRHAVLHDYDTGEKYMPLRHLSDEQAEVEIYNSTLSEAGVLGFEYGYSLDCPEGLVVWEAQFGDFANAGQVIIDQFISSAEDKWRRYSALVMLLPHGFEGMGPEHSSARLERFLSLCAEDNMQVVWPTTPAQYFHVLRRQVVRKWRKPLIVMSPKSLLRHRDSTSSLESLACGRFQRVIADAETVAAGSKRILLCSGKVYFELIAERQQRQRHDVAIVRLEQFYPFPAAPLRQALEAYPRNVPVCWVQDEPENMGAWRFLQTRLGTRVFDERNLFGVTRPESASPATGSHSSHKLEQSRLLNQAFEMPLDAA
ncbi:MAG: 2-oxoglutarate dehydrogenase E1 component [Myxococcota bacterium]